MLQAEGARTVLGGFQDSSKGQDDRRARQGPDLQGLGGHRKEHIYSKQVFSWGRIAD